MLGLLELMLFSWVHPGRSLVEVGHHVVGPRRWAVLHLVLLVCGRVVNFVLGLLCFVIFAVWRDVHVVALLFHLRPSFVADQFVFRVFFEESLGCRGSDCNLIIFTLV